LWADSTVFANEVNQSQRLYVDLISDRDTILLIENELIGLHDNAEVKRQDYQQEQTKSGILLLHQLS
jgi:hypothetical protein